MAPAARRGRPGGVLAAAAAAGCRSAAEETAAAGHGAADLSPVLDGGEAAGVFDDYEGDGGDGDERFAGRGHRVGAGGAGGRVPHRGRDAKAGAVSVAEAASWWAVGGGAKGWKSGEERKRVGVGAEVGRRDQQKGHRRQEEGRNHQKEVAGGVNSKRARSRWGAPSCRVGFVVFI